MCNNHTQRSGVRFLTSPLLWVRVSPGCTESRGQPGCRYLKTQRGDLFPSSLMWLMVASGPHWRMPETWKGPRRSSQCDSSFPQRVRATASETEVTAGAVKARHFRHTPLVASQLHLQRVLEAWPQEGVAQAAGVILALPEASTTPKPTFPSSAGTSDSTSKSKVDIKPGNVDIFFSTRS